MEGLWVLSRPSEGMLMKLDSAPLRLQMEVRSELSWPSGDKPTKLSSAPLRS